MTRGAGHEGRPPGKLATLAFRLFLLSFPRSFRGRFAEEMKDEFADWYAEARGSGVRGMVCFMTRTAFDMLINGVGERRRVRSLEHQQRMTASDSRNRPMRNNRETDFQVIDTFLRDVMVAFRSSMRTPIFTMAVLVTVALGVGATTSIFSVVNGVLLTPLPYDQPDRLARLFSVWDDGPDALGSMSKQDLRDFQELPAFDAVVGYRTADEAVTGLGDAYLVPGARVTSGILAAFGLDPVLGRDLRFEESSWGAASVVLVSHTFWEEELGRDPDVLGRRLEIQGAGFEIVGVAPPGFGFPDRAHLWRPLIMPPDGCGRDCHYYNVVARLSSSTNLDNARDQTLALGERLEELHPDANRGKGFRAIPLEEVVVGDVRAQLWILLGAVGLVLLVACANVANLLLARAHGRMGEVGVRAALGASRARLIAHSLTESLVLAVMGGAGGVGLAFGGVAILRRMSSGAVPRIDEVGVNGSVLLFALALVFGIAVLFGLIPALRISSSSPSAALGRTRLRGTTGGRGRGARNALLAAEMALSVLLLVGSGLLLRTLGELQGVPLGYRTEDILTFDIVLPRGSYSERSGVAGFFSEMEERIGGLPGVVSVGSVYGAPLRGSGLTSWLWVEGRPKPEPEDETSATLRPVTPGYFETMGVPILLGRGIEESDDEGSTPAIVVNETFVRQNFPGQVPIGEQFRIFGSFGFGNPTYTIVGVIPDLRSESVAGPPVPEVYPAQRQVGPGSLTVAVRTRPGLPPPLQAIRSEIRTMDPTLPPRNVETMEQLVADDTASTRFLLVLISLFAGIAVTLSAVGLYGVIAFLTSQRRQEIGIRLALGAHGGGVVGLMLRQASLPVALGLGLGLAGAWSGAQVLQSLLFQVDSRDPLVFIGATSVLLGVALLAALVPALKASGVDPVQALNTE